MTPLFKKLNLGGTPAVYVHNAPESYEPEVAALSGVQVMRAVTGEVGFALAFVTTLAEVESAAAQLTKHAIEDATLWMVYPKSTSRRYNGEFKRDTGWANPGAADYEPVRQVAVDEDWSALRFRRVENIRTMKRHPDGAISVEGQKKARQQREAGAPRKKGVQGEAST